MLKGSTRDSKLIRVLFSECEDFDDCNVTSMTQWWK